jgi:hypothetical protein
VKLLVAKSDETDDFVAIYVKLDKLTGVFRISLCDDLSECIGRLTDIIDLSITDAELIHVKVIELDLFVHEVHSCIEALLDVVLDVFVTDADLVQERGEVGAGPGCEQRGLDGVVIERETDV